MSSTPDNIWFDMPVGWAFVVRPSRVTVGHRLDFTDGWLLGTVYLTDAAADGYSIGRERNEGCRRGREGRRRPTLLFINIGQVVFSTFIFEIVFLLNDG